MRNYGQPDSMVYPKSGFLWDNALAHGKTARVWGEYAPYFTSPSGENARGTWSQWYQDSQILEGKATGNLHVPVGYYQTKTDVPSLDRILSRDYPELPDEHHRPVPRRHVPAGSPAARARKDLPTSTCCG